ncbi:helix-turn-helix domain-containing protein [Nitriliruptor alkaliphilus]|uniref:arsenate reductase/protein-tyrosine-phosphatase family protein n=1 Tax=Nitriliruptor alkaliphilus TaxID=427918 RepID=UPI001B804625|nr:helix-turn-helix domain-containing protein [Nitriliruptor alkaliphilus]
MTELPSSLDDRVALHHALGEPTRLRIVDALQLSDRSPKQLVELTGVPTNLLAFHLNVLEDAGVIQRGPSQGDARRRYVRLRTERLAGLTDPRPLPGAVEHVVFVCTANSARSQLAAQLWQARTGRPALSAGTEPAPQVHPLALAVAERHSLDLADAVPRRYSELEIEPDLVVSVCDRAHESDLDIDAPTLHWSVPDPADGGPDGFAAVFELLSERIDRLARAVVAV